ncbi:Hypothetical predicted protein [Xyrichtys novacula]|uniref:Uncharacterized protein n=1 Tax=Xyrichtys novacula TaxID=13765 RepID=A0AAV1H865_XYRNO|nr:Hypothetical predicted protein [Xyrichtys novacula]
MEQSSIILRKGFISQSLSLTPNPINSFSSSGIIYQLRCEEADTFSTSTTVFSGVLMFDHAVGSSGLLLLQMFCSRGPACLLSSCFTYIHQSHLCPALFLCFFSLNLRQYQQITVLHESGYAHGFCLLKGSSSSPLQLAKCCKVLQPCS